MNSSKIIIPDFIQKYNSFNSIQEKHNFVLESIILINPNFIMITKLYHKVNINEKQDIIDKLYKLIIT